MAEEQNRGADNLSVVRYDTNREVVLRHPNADVVFDPSTRQLVLLNPERAIEAQLPSPHRCHACGRSLSSDENESNRTTEEDKEPTLINNEYFRMLARSLPNSNISSAPTSPRLRIAQPVQSQYRAPSVTNEPPPDAEFIGSTPARPTKSFGISETAFVPQYFEKFFVIEKELGRGGKGVVLLVRHVLDRVTLGRFACKRVPVGNDHTWLEKVLMEVQALQGLGHANLVSYHHVWLEDYQISPFGPPVPCAFILQQYCNGGDIHTYVCGPAQVQITARELKEGIRRRSQGQAEAPQKFNEPRKLHLEEIYSFFKDITEGLAYLHANGFIHRDLKPQNCLIHRERGSTKVLVSDFGEVQYENTIRKSTGSTGTISYCAPEVLAPVSPGGPLGNFTFKSDIFSLGMILHFMCFADLPYVKANILHEEQEDIDELRAEIVSWSGFTEKTDKRTDLPSRLYSVLRQLLSLDVNQRPSADDVLKGIKSGGDFVPELRRRNSASPDDMMPAGLRVTRIETPTPNTRKRDRTQDQDIMSPTRQVQTRMRRQSSINSAVYGDNLAMQEDKSESGRYGATMMRQTSSQGMSRSRPMSRQTSHEPLERASPGTKSPRTRDQQQLMLPAPPSRGSSNVVWARLLMRPVSSNVSIVVLLFKLISMVQPCLPQATNPWPFYTLAGVAALEFCFAPRPVLQMVALLLLHCTILWFTISHGTLCRPDWYVHRSKVK